MAAAPLALILLLAGQAESSEAEHDPVALFEQGRKLAVEGQWTEAARVLTPLVDPEQAPADAVVLLTRAVYESGDLRRARLLAERGVLRFPEDRRFRRLDLAVLIARQSWPEAALAAKSILAKDPTDALAWRQLAAATLALPDEAERRAVLEAAYLANPEAPDLFERHLRAQLMAGHLATAASLAQAALTHPKLTADPRFVRLAVRAAEAAQNPKLARHWLAQIPPAERDTSLSLLEARIALAEDDPKAAEAALSRLIARGTADAAILIRAGDLAEKRGDFGRAEALYAQAAEGDSDAARIARLTWARLLAKIGNRTRAERILRVYLAEHPEDAYARQLLRITQATMPP